MSAEKPKTEIQGRHVSQVVTNHRAVGRHQAGMAGNRSAKNGTVRRKRSAGAAARRRRETRRNLLLLGVGSVLLVTAVMLIVMLLSRGGTDRPVVAQQTAVPTAIPTERPTKVPTEVPTEAPTEAPIAAPTAVPAPELSMIDMSEYTENGLSLDDAELSDRQPYGIYVSKDSFTFAILGIDENGGYTRLLRTFRTAIGTGNKTRAGNYVIDQKWDWYAWADGGYTPYTMHLEGTKMRLHAPLHNRNEQWDSLYKKGYEQIGTKATQGCLRTTCQAAAWVYFNCDVGTAVVIANDSMFVSEDPPPLAGADSDPTRPMDASDLEIPMTYFELDAQDVRLTVGEQKSIAASSILPDMPLEWKFMYVSGDEAIVQVDGSGVITAVGPGLTKVLVVADDINRVYRYIEVLVEE